MDAKQRKANALYQRRFRKKNLRDVRKAIVSKGAELKREVFEHYATTKYCDRNTKDNYGAEVTLQNGMILCACCGEDKYKFLCLDHINNDGNEDRKRNPSHATGRSLYSRLKREGFPDGYQILCYNCNMGKYINGGTCPHND